MSIVENEFYNNEKQMKISQIPAEIAQCLVQSGIRPEGNVYLAAYLLHKVSQDISHMDNITLEDIYNGKLDIDEDTRCFAKAHLSEEAWKQLLRLVNYYTPEELAWVALFPGDEEESKTAMTTPHSIIKLAQSILCVQDGERVADLGCGIGSFLVAEAQNQNKAHYYGYEINEERGAIAKIRVELLGADVHVQLCDVFNLVKDNPTPKFDKIFSNYPFGMKLRYLGEGTEYMERLSRKYPGLSKATSSDWIFNALLCDLLAEEGKAVGIMTNGSTWNSIDTPMRKYFVERKLIECVITLPTKMFSYTNVGTTLIVLSHNNERVRMIDASQICMMGRRQNLFSEDDIATIVDAMHTDSDYSREVSIDELRENDYNLSLERYMQCVPAFANGVPFESVIRSISRGAPCTASQLDTMVSNEVTNMQYLMLANIQNGIIDDKLPYLSSIEPKYEKYCLKNNDLILSKNGYPYKVAVASVREDQRILANGNLYIIELDKSRANPYYVKAFFESEQGIATLKNITVGATIPNIGVDKLKKVLIPLPSMEEQNRIAQKYQAAQDEIAMLKLRLERAIDKLHHVFDEESAENNA